MNRQSTRIYALLAASALLYPLPFYYPQSLFWLSFIFIVPLLYAALIEKLSYKAGYLWGFIALTGHQLAVLYGVFMMAEGSFLVRLVPVLFLLFFCPMFASIWFFLAEQLSRHVSGPVQRVCIWVITAWLYQLWMNYYQLWPFGAREGYLLLNPLVPLAEHPGLLWMLPFWGVPALSLYLFICAGLITSSCYAKSWRTWLICIVACTPWLAGFIPCKQQCEQPAWLSQIGVLQQTFIASSEQPSVMQVQECCARLKQHIPSITTILCPESCIHEPDLACHFMVYAEQHDAILESIQLIMGGFCYEAYDEDAYRNTAYFLDHNKVVRTYYKRHAMALTERMPRGCTSRLIHDLYFQHRPQVVPSHTMRPLWVVAGQPVVPYICSELFFTRHPDDHYAGVTIMALCNDLWAPAPARYLMYLGARLRALEWQRDILYVSYYYAVFISKEGFVWQLQVFPGGRMN